jgi:hydrogenase nickel incorporation protein HypA/HybF
MLGRDTGKIINYRIFMHELGIAESALSAALKEMEKAGAKQILSVTLRIGDLAAVDPEAMRFAFEAVTQNTAAEGASLEIKCVEGAAWCAICSEVFTTSSAAFCKCPRCGNYSGDLRAGREIELARLEMD